MMIDDDSWEPLLRVMALHAIEYCERLFYLEEVEEIRLADDRVYAGRTLHTEVAPELTEEWRTWELSSNKLGIVGKADAVRHRDGHWVPYEHKRGRPMTARGKKSEAMVWPSDLVQVCAYGMLIEEHTGRPVVEGRVRYHQGNVSVRIPLNQENRQLVLTAIERARHIRRQPTRPPVSVNERLCLHCSLAPVCLPEEERLAEDSQWETVRLFPPHPEGQVIHVISHDSYVRRAADTIKIETEADDISLPINDVQSIVLHGNCQITTQALHLCAANGVGVHWLTGGGNYVAGLAAGTPAVQRHVRQYTALCDENFRLNLACRLVQARAEGQLRYLLRATRDWPERTAEVKKGIEQVRRCLKDIAKAKDPDSLRGFEGMSARAYFETLPLLLSERVDNRLRPQGRNRRPPQDRFNALLSFGYALLYRSVLEAVMAVGLEPSLGFYHTARSAAQPLVLDIMELFRLPIWDVAVIGSVNRLAWDANNDFVATKDKVWLSESGKKKAIGLYERRCAETWKHPVTDYSLSYKRTIELEVRLLEKEWTSRPGLFACSRLR